MPASPDRRTFPKRTKILVAAAALLAMSTSPGGSPLRAAPPAATKAAAEPATPPALPKIVLLGDSIREGYAPIVAELLAGRAVVVTPKANGRDTATLLTNLDAWAVGEQPQVIHFNCGIHDTKRNKATDRNLISPEQYEANLRKIVGRLRAETKARVVFALSTPLIDERSQEAWKTRSYRLINASITEYNAIARRVMKELDVPVNDVPAALGDSEETARLLDKGGIHFTPEGSRKLAQAVAAFVTDYLPAAAPAAPGKSFECSPPLDPPITTAPAPAGHPAATGFPRVP